jgi:small-conductance mechanosensitive channel
MTTLLLVMQTEAAQGGGATADLLSRVSVIAGVRALVTVLIGVPIVFVVSGWARRLATARISPQVGLVAGKLLFYLGLVILVITTMTELGFSLAPLLGAAGVVGIALGFASQTSVSNIIAGLFLLAERPFIVDDLIQVDQHVGRVLSVDTMSVKLRTFDNRFVRIPNETLVKSTVINITRFPIRRLDVRVGVAYKEDPQRVRKILLDVAEKNPIALVEPEPLVIFEGFGESSLDMLFAVWTTRENWRALKNSLQEGIKTRFDAEGIEIPFPHRTLYVGSETEAFPVRMVQDERLRGEQVKEAEAENGREGGAA